MIHDDTYTLLPEMTDSSSSDSPVSPLKAFLARRESHHLKKEPERVTREVRKLSLLASSSLIYIHSANLKRKGKKFKLEHVSKPLENISLT